MLLLVTKSRLKTGFFSRRKAKRGKLPPVLSGIHLGSYPAVTVEFWQEDPRLVAAGLAAYLRRGDVVVVHRSLEEKLRLNEPHIQEFTRRQWVNFCVEAIRQEEKHRRLQTALVDCEGECVGVAAELLGVCDTLWVATQRPELFGPCAAYTQQQYGNQPLLTDGRLPPVDLVVAPYGMGELPLPKGGIVAGPGGNLCPQPEDLILPPEAEHVRLPEIPPLAVAAGLFAAFSPPSFLEPVPKTLHLDGRPVTPKTLWEG